MQSHNEDEIQAARDSRARAMEQVEFYFNDNKETRNLRTELNQITHSRWAAFKFFLSMLFGVQPPKTYSPWSRDRSDLYGKE